MNSKDLDDLLIYTFEVGTGDKSEEAAKRTKRWRESGGNFSMVQRLVTPEGIEFTTGLGIRASDTQLYLIGSRTYTMRMHEVPHSADIYVSNPLTLQGFQAKWGKRDITITDDSVDGSSVLEAKNYVTEYVADCREYFISILDKLRGVTGDDISRVPYPLALINVRDQVDLEEVKSKLGNIVYHLDYVLNSEESLKKPQ